MTKHNIIINEKYGGKECIKKKNEDEHFQLREFWSYANKKYIGINLKHLKSQICHLFEKIINFNKLNRALYQPIIQFHKY